MINKTHRHVSVEQDIGFVAKWIAPRWKTVVAFVVTLAGAIGEAFPASTQIHALNGFVTMAAAVVGVHQVQNAGVAPVQQVVNAVTALLPPSVTADVSNAINNTTTGVLASAVGPSVSVSTDIDPDSVSDPIVDSDS